MDFATLIPTGVLVFLGLAWSFYREPKIRRRIAEREATGIDMRAVERVIPTRLAPEAALSVAEAVIVDQPRLTPATPAIEDGRKVLRARQSATWDSWGQVLTVRAEPAQSEVRLVLRSWPVWDRQAIGGRAGQRLVDSVADRILAQLSRDPA